MTRTAPSSPAEKACHVIALTAQAWRIEPASPGAVARRAPHGHVRARVVRRIQVAAAQPGRPLLLLAHSW